MKVQNKELTSANIWLKEQVSKRTSRAINDEESNKTNEKGIQKTITSFKPREPSILKQNQKDSLSILTEDAFGTKENFTTRNGILTNEISFQPSVVLFAD